MKNKTDKVIAEIKELTGLEIINKSNQGIPLFNVPSQVNGYYNNRQ